MTPADQIRQAREALDAVADMLDDHPEAMHPCVAVDRYTELIHEHSHRPSLFRVLSQAPQKRRRGHLFCIS